MDDSKQRCYNRFIEYTRKGIILIMNIKDVVNISLFATLLAVCAWLCIPTVVPVTMQTFAVFLALLVLGGKKGIIVITIYLFLGIAGIPVFAKGTAGVGVLFGSTGGYMIGWIFIAAVMIAVEKIIKRLQTEKMRYKKWIQAGGLVTGLILCYFFGTLWFVNIYAGNTENVGFGAAFGVCVVPFIIPDLIKMVLAFSVSKRIRNIVRNV